MHYYQFNIGDYASHTQHLDEIEDLAYRRMLDYCYLNEIGLPESVDEVARLIRMRTHSVCIANVLREFFTLHSDGVWRSERVERELQAFRDKSGKAAKAARKRWDKADANALQTHSERNANHKPITNNHKPVKESRAAPFTPPTVEQVADYLFEKGIAIDPNRFVDFYESKGWMVGKTKMKCWKAAVRTWSTRNEQPNRPSSSHAAPKQTAAQRIAARRIELASQSPDVGVVAADDRDVWPPLDEPAGRGAQRYLGEGTS